MFTQLRNDRLSCARQRHRVLSLPPSQRTARGVQPVCQRSRQAVRHRVQLPVGDRAAAGRVLAPNGRPFEARRNVPDGRHVGHWLRQHRLGVHGRLGRTVPARPGGERDRRACDGRHAQLLHLRESAMESAVRVHGARSANGPAQLVGCDRAAQAGQRAHETAVGALAVGE